MSTRPAARAASSASYSIAVTLPVGAAQLAPPWAEIYALDQERRHGLAEAVAEYDRLIGVYPSLGYDIYVLPKVSVAERADWILASLAG